IFAGTIDFYHSLMGSKEAARKELLSNFTKQTGIKVNDIGFFDIFQWQQKTLAAVAAGLPPDVASNHYYFVPQYAVHGTVEPLDEHFKDWRIDVNKIFAKEVLKMNSYKGKLYGIPLFVTCRVLLYNKDIFKEAGLNPNKPPRNWEDLVDFAKKLTIWKGDKLVRAGFKISPSPEMRTNFFYILLWELGGRILNEDETKAVFNSEAGVKALTFFRDLYLKYKVTSPDFGKGTKGASDPFIAKKAAMSFAGPYDLVNLKKYVPNMNVGVAFIPRPVDGQYATLLDSFSIFAFKGAKHKKDALQFVKYASSYDAQLQFSKTSCRLPGRLDALSDPYFSAPAYKVFQEAIGKYGHALPTLPQWTEIQQTILDAIEKVIYSNVDPKTALDEAVRKVNTQILH
ncbi:MAG: hypothetical protein DRP50_02155, partial [Thermotoga sp.]